MGIPRQNPMDMGLRFLNIKKKNIGKSMRTQWWLSPQKLPISGCSNHHIFGWQLMPIGDGCSSWNRPLLVHLLLLNNKPTYPTYGGSSHIFLHDVKHVDIALVGVQSSTSGLSHMASSSKYNDGFDFVGMDLNPQNETTQSYMCIYIYIHV